MPDLEVTRITSTLSIHWPDFIIWPTQPQGAGKGNPTMLSKRGESEICVEQHLCLSFSISALVSFLTFEVGKVGWRRENRVKEATVLMVS